jgi:atypical dual specificity phosphatase
MSEWFERFGFGPAARGLLTGAYPADEADVAALAGAGVQEIVNLCEDAEYEPGAREAVEAALAGAGIGERRIELVDYGAVPEPALAYAVSEVMRLLDEGRRVYLHCRAGWQRSAAVAAAVIALREDLEIEDALAVLRQRRPMAAPLEHQRADLLAWWSAQRL